MNDRELANYMGRKIRDAMNDMGSDLSDLRQENFNYYYGKPYGNERDGFSSVVTRESFEVVEWALPSVLRVFTSGEQVATFDAVGPEDEPVAEQETDVVNHYIQKENNWFLIAHDWAKDALMYPNGYLKVWCEEEERTVTEYYKGVTAQGLVDLDQVGDILEQYSEVRQTELGPVELWDVKLRRDITEKKLKITNCPPDEVLVDNDCTSVNLDEADFVCHRTQKTFTQLVNEGYDRKKLEAVGTDEGFEWGDERVNRLFYEDESPDDEDDSKAMRKYWVHECFGYVDYDGDGVAERRHVVMIGRDIFENEEIEYQPMVSLASIVMPHKHTGMSWLETAKELQLICSTLTRNLLNNIYRLNIRRKYISEQGTMEDGSTMDALLDATSEFIPVRGDPNAAIVPEQVQPIIGEILPVIQHLQDRTQVRTGVAPGLSLDPDVLRQSTEGAFMGAMEKASERVEMLVRIFAETGFRQLICKVHQLLRLYMDVPKAVKIRNQWTEVKPSEWRERNNVTINVGLGHNNKNQTLQILMNLLGLQREALQIGLANPEKIYNTTEKLVEHSSVGHVEEFFVDPRSPEYQQWQQQQAQAAKEQQEPMAQAAMIDAQAKMMGEQTRRMEAQIKANEVQQKAMRESQEFQTELQLKLNDEQRKNQEMLLRMRELEAQMNKMFADQGLTEAQTAKTLQEAKGAGLENDAVEKGVYDLLEASDEQREESA